MIIFINIGNQIGYAAKDRGGVEFAFYDTVRNRFLEFDNEQMWYSYAAVQHSLIQDLEKENIEEDFYQRILNLIPEELK
jgi:hypothetical protein